MDFTPDPAQQAVADVVTSVLDRDNSWDALVAGGVTALPAPERVGGDGVGLPEVTTALTEIGRHGLISPALVTLGLGAIALLDLASDEQQDRYLSGLGKGSLLTAALNEPGTALPERPATTFVHSRLSGTKVGVGYAENAEWMIVTTDSAVVVVSPRADGVHLSKTPTSNGSDEYVVTFSDVAVAEEDVLTGATVQRANQLALAAIGAYTAGLVAGALRLTADYVANRQQFGKPLSTFQTVAAQLAEVYIASRTIDLASTSVIWRLAEGRMRPRCAGRSRRARLLDYLAGAAGDANLPPPARRHGDGHHLPDAPVLLHDQGPDPAAGRAVASSRPGGSAMFIDLTPEQRQLQAELRQYFSNLISSDEMKAMENDRHNEAYRAVIKRMGQDGKLGVGWPKEFGGLGFGPIEQSIFVNEAHRADVPLPAVTLQTVGPVLQQFGSELQKKKFLPSILAGEVHFAIGYTEPEAGTDLASLRTTAVRHGDEYIVNGQKIFTTGAHDADYIWLACRTDPEAVKHKGISILIVDTKDPGYSWTPIILSDGAHHTNATYLQRRPGARRHVGRRGERWMAADHHPAQQRAGDARPGGPHGRHLRPGARLGVQARWRRRYADRPRRRQAGARRDLFDVADQRAARTGRSPPLARTSTWPMLRRRKSLAPSAFSISAGWPRRSSASTATRPSRTLPSCWNGWTRRPSAIW